MSNEKTIDFVLDTSRSIADFAMDLSTDDDPIEAREHIIGLLASIANNLAGEYLGEDDSAQLLADVAAIARFDTKH